MKLREVMTRMIQLVSSSQSIQEAAQLMRDQDIGMVLVFTGPQIVGILTDRDIAINATARGLNPTRARVSDAMTKNVISCPEDASIEDAIKTMKENQIRRLVVTDRDRRPVGVVSLGDLAIRGDKPALSEELLHEVSEDRLGVHH